MFERVLAVEMDRPCKPRHRFTIIFVLLFAVVLSGSAAADFDSSEWKRFREVRIPPQVPEGLAGIPLESDVIEKCRRDMADLKLVSSDGALVPFTIAEGSAGDDGEPFPARVFRMARKQGKWTDIWIDKQAKILTKGILVKTPSKDFLRRVEIRGSDNAKETYVVRMDGLIADIPGSVPVRSLNVLYHVNNFQYVHIRIIDNDKPPLKVEGVLCYPPPTDSSLSYPLEARIRENRSDPSTGSTTVVVDLGQKRFPVASIRVSSTAKEFTKRAAIYAAASPSSGSWKHVSAGTLFRIRRDNALKENLEVRFRPQTCRYIKLELSNGSRGAVAIDRLQATAALRVAVFKYRRGQEYRLLFDNPDARDRPPAHEVSSTNVNQIASTFSEISLGPEQKNIVSSSPKKPEKSEKNGVSQIQKILGVALLLTGLLLLFIVMLKARSSRRSRGRRGSGVVNIGF
jgi:hypothetical protein